MKYDKPHLSYEEQVAKLSGRGLCIEDETAAVALLRSVGYYRLSAYIYPFRTFLPESERTPGHTRSELLHEGVSIAHVRALWEFDRNLRLLVLDATEVIEVGLRTQIAYVLGRRDVFGHVSEDSLDEARCDRVRVIDGVERRAFDLWEDRYNDLRRRASREDYVIHNTTKYPDSPLAIWVAVEFLDFGAALRLFGLLRDEDSNEIARSMGFTSGAKLYKVLLTCSNVRNTAAHHARTWNRPPVTQPPKIYKEETTDPLPGWQALRKSFMYAPLLLMAYLVRQIDSTSRWPVRARERLLKFPTVPLLNVNDHMGAPDGWDDLDIWRHRG